MKPVFRPILIVSFFLLALIILLTVVYRDRRPRIYFAAAEGDTNSLAKYFASGSNVNGAVICYIYGGQRFAPLLDVAIENGQEGAVLFLLQRGANPNQPDWNGVPPLMYSIGRTKNNVSEETRLRIFQMLLKAGAGPNSRSTSGFWTPLIEAASFGQLEMVSALLAAGASVTATNNEGQTELHFAANAEVAQMLLAAGADPTAKAGGETPAESAARFGHFSTLKVLTNIVPQPNH